MELRFIRLFTGEDGQSHFEEKTLALQMMGEGHGISDLISNSGVAFEETTAGGTYDWHNAPRRQYVLTLSGNLEFETRLGEKFMIRPGDILLAEDVSGGGHRWKLVDDQPWRRLYVHL